MDSNLPGIYHPSDTESSPLWRLFNDHFETFERNYEEKFEKKYGFWRPVIKDVVDIYFPIGYAIYED